MGNMMRMTGFSGLDVEGMVAQLMRAERVRHDRLFQQSITLGWRQEGFINASNSLRTFQSSFLRQTNTGAANSGAANNRLISQRASWTRDMITSSSSSAVGIAGASGTRAGDFSVMVNRLATRDIFDSGNFSTSVTGQNAFDVNNLAAGSFEVSFNGANRTITLTQDDIDAIHTAISDSGGDVEAGNAEFLNILNGRLQQEFGSITTQSSSQQRITAGFDSYGRLTFNPANSNDTIAVKSGTLDIENVFDIDEGQATNNMASRNINSVLGLSGNETFTINGVNVSTTDNMTVQQFLTAVNQANNGVNMSFNNSTGQFVLQSAQTGAANSITFDDNFRNAFNIGGPREVAHDAEFTVNGQVFTSATNTGVTTGALGLTLNLNEVTESEVTITVRNNVQAAFDMIMDWMEGYNEVLRTLSGMTTEQRARTNSGGFFLPLTEEQRRGMSDADIARWEEQAKQGVLRNDPALQRVEQEMRRWILEPVTLSDGRQISLHEIGISTGNWRNGGQLELFTNHRGDTVFTMELLEERFDDIMEMFTRQSTSAAWSNMPGTTATQPGVQNQRMRENGIAFRLDDIIRNAIENDRSSINMAGGLRNGEANAAVQNSPMNIQMQDVQRRMAAALLDLNRRENNFFAMFSRMEQAMMRSDQQMASLMSALGGGF